jgi:hypothetical protein
VSARVWHTLCILLFEEQIFIKIKEMKKFICTTVLTVLIASMTAVSAQNNPEEYLGLPGDNLNLYATMKLFQESETLEAFERDLNDEKSKINNLDLNGDNLVDYITVTDYVDGNVHTIALRTALNKKESQDVAVFTVQQFKDGSVQIQLVGDELLYGKNYIVEPIYAETPNPGYTGTTVYTDNVKVVTTTYYEVAAWPVIRFIYNPYYVSWHSSWYWGYYPVYWNPWRPYYWHYYYGYHYNWHHDYYAHYRHCDYYRHNYYDDHYYHSSRHYSAEVAHRVSAGNYAGTYSHPEQRKDGEAMYARTQGSRSADTRRQSSVQSTNSAQRSSAEVSQRSAADPTRRSSASETQRSATASTQRSASSGSATVQRSEASRQQASVQKSQPSASREQASVQRSQPSASRQQASVQKSQPSASRQQASMQKSQPSASRQQASVQKSQPSASRQQASMQKSQPSRPSAPEARSSGRHSSQGSSSQSRSSAPSQKSNSSRGSDNDRSSPR